MLSKLDSDGQSVEDTTPFRRLQQWILSKLISNGQSLEDMGTFKNTCYTFCAQLEEDLPVCQDNKR